MVIRASNLGGKWFSETLGLRNARKENKVMSLLDFIVSNAFRDEKAGRVVVFSGDRRSRGYIVRSAAEELKIKSFLKMFYFAHFYILLLGMMLANSWSAFFVHLEGMGKPVEHTERERGRAQA